MYKAIELKDLSGFQFLKEKKEDQASGDAFWFEAKNKDKFSFVLCDGVSSSESDSESSQITVKTLSKFIQSKRNISSLRKELFTKLDSLNNTLLKKNLSTTLCMFSKDKDQNLVVATGDSAILIFDQNRNLCFYNNIYNLKHSSEGVFEEPSGLEHMLINCLGHGSCKYETSFNVPLPDQFEVLCFSDGALQYIESPKKLFEFVDRVLMDKEKFELPVKNFDDFSMIYLKSS